MKRLLVGLLAVSAQWVLAYENLPVHDGDFSCIDSAKADRYISDFNIDIRSFGGKELCRAETDSKKLFNDLQLIEEGRFQDNLSNLFIRNFVDRNNYYGYLQRETRGIQRGNDVPFATAYNSGGYFTMQDGWAKLSTLGRVGVVLHEARHTEGYYHVVCNQGPYLGTSVQGCDTKVEDAGSHAIEMEYYARVVVQGSNFHPVFQDMARLMLLARSNFVFNSNPLSPRDELIARTESGFVRFKNNRKQEFSWPEAANPNALLKRTSFGTSLVQTPREAKALTFKQDGSVAAVSDDYSYFKLLKVNIPNSLREMEEFDVSGKRYLVALDNQSNAFTYIFDRGRWSSPRKLGAERFVTVDPTGSKGLYAVFANSTFCPLDLRSLQCQSIANPWPGDAKQFVEFENSVLKLNTNGAVTTADGSPWDELKGVRTLDLIKIPAYDVFDKGALN